MSVCVAASRRYRCSCPFSCAVCGAQESMTPHRVQTEPGSPVTEAPSNPRGSCSCGGCHRHRWTRARVAIIEESRMCRAANSKSRAPRVIKFSRAFPFRNVAFLDATASLPPFAAVSLLIHTSFCKQSPLSIFNMKVSVHWVAL